MVMRIAFSRSGEMCTGALLTAQVSLREAGRIFHQEILPATKQRTGLDQAAQPADVLGHADRGGADQHVVLELQADIAGTFGVDVFDVVAALGTPPLPEGGGDQAKGGQYVDGENARQQGIAAGHVDGGNPCLVGGISLNDGHQRFAGEEVAAFGHVASRVDALDRGAHAVVDANAAAHGDRGAGQEVEVGRNTGPDDDDVEGQDFVGRQGYFQRCIGIAVVDTLDAGRGAHANALFLDPVLDHAAGLFGHHARHHAVAHFDDGQIHAAGGQRFHDDAADEAGTQLQYAAARFGQRGDGAGIGHRPAILHLGTVEAGDGRVNRAGAGGDQEFVVAFGRAVGVADDAGRRIERHGAAIALGHAQLGEMIGGLAQIHARLPDVAFEVVRDGHARIGGQAFAADHDDFTDRVVAAQCFGGDDAGRAVAKNEIFHRIILAELQDADARQEAGADSACSVDTLIEAKCLRSRRRGRLQAESGQGFGGRNAVLRPAAYFVVFRQHLAQFLDLALGRTGFGRFGGQARRQVVILGRKAGSQVELTLHVPDALADDGHLFHRPVAFAGGLNLGLHVGNRPGEGGEQTATGRVENRRRILEGLDETRLAFSGQRIGLDRDTEHFGSHGVAADVAGTAVGGGIVEADTLNAATVVSREFQALDAHRQVRTAVFGGQALAAEADFLAETFAAGGDFSHVGQCLGRAERSFDTDLFLGQDAEFVHFHDGRDGGAEGDRVEAVFVAEHVGVLQGFQIADAVGGTERPGAFVLKAAGGAPVFRLVLNREVALVELGDAAAGDGATEAGSIGNQMGLAVGRALFVHGFGGDLAGLFELHVAVVAGGQGADFVDHVHQHLGAVFRQALAGDGVVLEHLLGGIGCLEEGREVLDAGNALGAANGDGLEVLGTHDGADAGTAGSTVQVIDDAGEEHLVFARAADRGDANQRILEFGLDGFLGVPAGRAPQVGGVAQFGLVVFDVEVNRLRRLAFEDDHVPAGELQFGTEVATGIGAGDGAGQRTLGDHGVTAAGGGHGAGQRTGGHDHLVFGRQRVDLGIDFLDQVLGAEAARAEVFVGPLHVQGFGGAGTGSQVDPQNFSVPAHVLSP